MATISAESHYEQQQVVIEKNKYFFLLSVGIVLWTEYNMACGGRGLLGRLLYSIVAHIMKYNIM